MNSLTGERDLCFMGNRPHMTTPVNQYGSLTTATDYFKVTGTT